MNRPLAIPDIPVLNGATASAGAAPADDSATGDGPVLVPRRSPAAAAAVRWTRHTLQAAIAGLVIWQVYGHVTAGAPSAEAFCPLAGFETLWTWATTGKTVSHVHWPALVFGAAVVAMALIGRGFFCGWLCPLGAVQGAVHAAGRFVTDHVPPLRRLRRRAARTITRARWIVVSDRVLRYGRFVVLGWALIGAGITGTMVFREADPWIALISIVTFEFSLAFVVLLVTLVLSLFVRRPFCRYACPLGAVQAILGTAAPVAIERHADACLGCDLCNQACPMGIPVNTRTRVTDSTCLGCLECVLACPSRDALGVTAALPLPARPRAADALPVPARAGVPAGATTEES